VPADEGIWLNDGQRALPVEKARQGHQSKTACRIDSTKLNASFFIEGQLFPEKIFFSRQLTSAASEVDEYLEAMARKKRHLIRLEIEWLYPVGG
jgi:hypothetical protein